MTETSGVNNERNNKGDFHYGSRSASLGPSGPEETSVESVVRSLARLDDETLRSLGVYDRDMIEFTVRYCFEC
jgi:hypothetical protein